MTLKFPFMRVKICRNHRRKTIKQAKCDHIHVQGAFKGIADQFNGFCVPTDLCFLTV